MTVFTARTSAEAVVAAPRQAIWDALTDPDTLASLTPYKVERKLRHNEFYYLYAVPEQNLVYIGNQAAYGKYQELLIQQEIANANLNAAEMQMNTAQQWNDWSCWGTTGVILPPPRMRGR